MDGLSQLLRLFASFEAYSDMSTSKAQTAWKSCSQNGCYWDQGGNSWSASCCSCFAFFVRRGKVFRSGWVGEWVLTFHFTEQLFFKSFGISFHCKVDQHFIYYNILFSYYFLTITRTLLNPLRVICEYSIKIYCQKKYIVRFVHYIMLLCSKTQLTLLRKQFGLWTLGKTLQISH